MKIGNTLSENAIESSKEIGEWLDQFSEIQRSAAIEMLKHLIFIPRDKYAKWLKEKLNKYSDKKCALYAVRKFNKTAESAWTQQGQFQKTPTTTLGSEDFVRSEISRAVKSFQEVFFDHPSIAVLRKHKIKNLILIDDSLGSGDRVSRYIQLLMNHKSIRSWWSFGWIHIYVVAFARTQKAEINIFEHLPGSNHNSKKYPAYKKITFDTLHLYKPGTTVRRWGNGAEDITKLCDSIKIIPPDKRKGYGEVMGNLIFYHSVPNNIPGVLYLKRNGWKPLFPERVIPAWLENLLKGNATVAYKQNFTLPLDAEEVLYLVHQGLKKITGLARRLEMDVEAVRKIVSTCISNGLILKSMHLTMAGEKYLRNKGKYSKKGFTFDFSIYIPKSWCTDHNPSSRPSDIPLAPVQGGDL